MMFRLLKYILLGVIVVLVAVHYAARGATLTVPSKMTFCPKTVVCSSRNPASCHATKNRRYWSIDPSPTSRRVGKSPYYLTRVAITPETQYAWCFYSNFKKGKRASSVVLISRGQQRFKPLRKAGTLTLWRVKNHFVSCSRGKGKVKLNPKQCPLVKNPFPRKTSRH